MRFFYSTFTLVILSAGTWATEEAKPNPVVEKAMSAALADAEKGYDSYRAILTKATDKAVKDMEKAKLDAMKKGDLASANELDARIKEMKEGGLEKLVMERKKAGGDLLGNDKGGATASGVVFGNQTEVQCDGKLFTISIGEQKFEQPLDELRKKNMFGGNIRGEVIAKGWDKKLKNPIAGEHPALGYIIHICSGGVVFYNGGMPTGNQCEVLYFNKPIK